MAHLLLIGGPFDGQVRDVDKELLTRSCVRLPERPGLLESCLPENVSTEPMLFKAEDYRIFTVEVRNPLRLNELTSIRFGYHHTITSVEAMVMLMQNYQKGSLR